MSGDLVFPLLWSRVVDSPEEARRALVAPEGAYDLRAAAELDDAWTAVGFRELVPGELICPVDVELASLDETQALGRRLAGALRAGDLVVLTGALGAGKTALAQGIGSGLGVRGPVTSPTFVLARRHPGPVDLLHADVYRLRDAARIDLDDLGLDDDMPSVVTVVEWGEDVVEELSESRLHVVLTRGHAGRQGDDLRTAQVRAVGPRWAVLARTKSAL